MHSRMQGLKHVSSSHARKLTMLTMLPGSRQRINFPHLNVWSLCCMGTFRTCARHLTDHGLLPIAAAESSHATLASLKFVRKESQQLELAVYW